MSILGPMDLGAALDEVRGEGFVVLYDVGSCGDGPFGSRLYLSRENAEKNRFGVPLERAEISFVGGAWYVAYYRGRPRGESLCLIS